MMLFRTVLFSALILSACRQDAAWEPADISRSVGTPAMSSSTGGPAAAPAADLVPTGDPASGIDRPAVGLDPGLPQAARPFPPGLSGELLFQSDREGATRMYVINLGTGRVQRAGPSGDWMDEEPKWSPDGRRIAFSSTRAQAGNLDIFVMDAEGANQVRLTDHPSAEQGPAWAADGQSLFFSGRREGREEIYRVWIGDKRVERVTSGIDRAIMPAASPDGRYLAYAAQTVMSFQLHLLDLHAGTTRQITQGGGACRPSFAPDSQELAFVRIATEPSRLETLREDGGRVVLEDKTLWSYYPDYSHDGRYLAFSVSPEHHRGEDWDLAIMDPQRPGQFVRLTSGPGNDRVPDWRPPVR